MKKDKIIDIEKECDLIINNAFKETASEWKWDNNEDMYDNIFLKQKAK